MFEINEGTLDRSIRIAVGFALLVFLIFAQGPIKWWGFLGLIPLLTGIFGSCPLYSLVGIKTCATPKS
jgi:hypothetical protein